MGIVGRLVDQALHMVADGELLPGNRFPRLEDALQFLLDGSKRVLRNGTYIDDVVRAFQSTAFLLPLDQGVVHKCVQHVHQAVFVLPQQAQCDFTSYTEDA